MAAVLLAEPTVVELALTRSRLLRAGRLQQTPNTAPRDDRPSQVASRHQHFKLPRTLGWAAFLVGPTTLLGLCCATSVRAPQLPAALKEHRRPLRTCLERAELRQRPVALEFHQLDILAGRLLGWAS